MAKQGTESADTKPKVEESHWYYVGFLEEIVNKSTVESVKEESLRIAEMIDKTKDRETEKKIEDIEHVLRYAKIPELYKKKFARMIKLMRNRANRGISENFGSLIKHLRESKGYSLQEMEEITGVSASYINRIEKGDRKAPSYRVIKKLAEGLNQDVNELINVANNEEEGNLQPVEELLLTRSFLIGGVRASKEMRERLVEIINKINNSSWGENKHRDAMDIMDSIERYKKSVNK